MQRTVANLDGRLQHCDAPKNAPRTGVLRGFAPRD
jgi:hypothetical protein